MKTNNYPTIRSPVIGKILSARKTFPADVDRDVAMRHHREGRATELSQAASSSCHADRDSRDSPSERHPQDAWLDTVPGKHRTFIDASTVSGGSSLLYAYNLYAANKSDYSLAERDVAVVVCFRHSAAIDAGTTVRREVRKFNREAKSE